MAIGQGIGWLDELRSRSRTAFRARGLPTPKSESWKYTSLKSLDGFAFARPSRGTSGAYATDAALAAYEATRKPAVTKFLAAAGRRTNEGAAVAIPGQRFARGVVRAVVIRDARVPAEIPVVVHVVHNTPDQDISAEVLELTRRFPVPGITPERVSA